MSGRALLGWTAALLAMTAASVAFHVYTIACNGEQTFDTAVAVQYLHLAFRGWGPSGLLGVSAFGDHFNPLFLLPAPFFALWPGALTLQIVKSLAYVAMLPAIALLARDRLGARAAPVAAAIVSVSAGFWISIAADYHAETLGAALLPWLLLAYERRRLRSTLALAVLVCLGKENLALVVCGIGAMARVERRSPAWWLGLAGIGAALFALAVFVVIPAYSPVSPQGSRYAQLATLAGWAATLGDPSLYRWLGFLLLSCGFLCLRAPRALLPAAPLLLQHGLSSWWPDRELGYHYTAPLVPLLAYASIAGFARIGAGRRRAAAVALLLINAVLLVTAGPGWRLSGMQRAYGAAELAARIPPGAPAWGSVSTVTRLALRDRLYMVENLTTGVYPGRLTPFDPARELAPEPPRHGLIDVRDAAVERLPPGLVASDAIGDLVLLEEKGWIARRVAAPLPSDARPLPGRPDLRIAAGRDGRYRVQVEDAEAGLPIVTLELVDAEGRVVDRRGHRLLYGLATAAGVWEARYRAPLLEAGRARGDGPHHLRIATDGGEGVPLTTWEHPGRPVAAGPSSLPVTVDSLRADHLGLYSYSRATSPHLDGWFADALVFDRAYATEATTAPSVAGILTGRLPQSHGVRLFYQLIPDGVPTLADALGRAGYQTAAVVSNVVLTDEAIGLGDRFDHYDDFVDEPEGARPVFERNARRTTDAALRWLRSARDARPAHAV